MNILIALVGAVVYYATSFVCGFVTGPIIHNGILAEAYQATAVSWRPELVSQPPDFAALFPYWVATGLLYGAVFSGFYSVVRSAFTGAAWLRGAKYGLGVGLLFATVYIVLHWFFNFPGIIWGMWALEAVIVQAICGAAVGAVAEKLAPVDADPRGTV